MPKQLGDFLKDQQEPFALEIYLLERGFTTKCSKNSTNSLHSKRKFIPKIITTLLNRFVPVNNNKHKIKNSGDVEKSKQEIADDDDKSLSSSSSSTTTNSSIKHDIKEARLATTERKQMRKNVEEGHQLSPVSVLEVPEKTESGQVSPVLKTKKYLERIQEASSLSISICVWNLEKPLSSNPGEMQQQLEVRDTHYNKNKKAMLQTKQLLLDCVREILENQRRINGQKILGAEELRKLIYENIWLWSQETINETNIEHILLASCIEEEWSNLEVQTTEIGNGIGDGILEDISNQIILDMINVGVS